MLTEIPRIYVYIHRRFEFHFGGRVLEPPLLISIKLYPGLGKQSWTQIKFQEISGGWQGRIIEI